MSIDTAAMAPNSALFVLYLTFAGREAATAAKVYVTTV